MGSIAAEANSFLQENTVTADTTAGQMRVAQDSLELEAATSLGRIFLLLASLSKTFPCALFGVEAAQTSMP